MDVHLIHRLISHNSDEEENDNWFLMSSSDEENERQPLRLRPKIINYVANVVNFYSGEDFKSHFRLSRNTFEILHNIIGADLQRPVKGHEMICSKTQLMIALWKMATTESYRSLSDRFNVGKATAYRSVRRVTKILVRKITSFVKWPTPSECSQIASNFYRLTSFPGIVGAIDGTHFEIESPKVNKDDYINRKGYPSLQMQAVCDDKCLFINIFVGYPGCVHDMRVFRISPVNNYLNNTDKFPNDSHIIGDSAYALHRNLMVPFKDNGHLTTTQKKFNKCLSSARMTIERAFGLLKGRWRSLLNCIPMHDVAHMPDFIAACCILHNVCLLNNDIFNVELELPMSIETEVSQEVLNNRGEALDKRNAIARNLPLNIQ